MSKSNNTFGGERNKYTFSLNGINLDDINTKYDIKLAKNNQKTTKISDLSNDNISFLDESKRSISCYVTMIDLSTELKVNDIKYKCFWCRENIGNVVPIGCPIKYVPKQVIKRYMSNISRDVYTIKENITSDDMIRKLENFENIKIIDLDYYVTDGIFCSPNCCQSYINDNKHNKLYDLSSFLLKNIYKKIFNIPKPNINPAPHWRTLKCYGGMLDIEKFRENFDKIDYKEHGNVIPKFIPLCKLYEESFKF